MGTNKKVEMTVDQIFYAMGRGLIVVGVPNGKLKAGPCLITSPSGQSKPAGIREVEVRQVADGDKVTGLVLQELESVEIGSVVVCAS